MITAKEFNSLLKKIKYDDGARTKFLNYYYVKLKFHLKTYIGSYSDWEDVLHDVIEKLISTDWGGYPYIEHPISWLFRMSDNCARDMIRREKFTCELPEFMPDKFNIDESLVHGELRAAMKKCLPPEEQYIFYLYLWGGYSLKEIAEILGVSYAGIRTKVSRAYKILKENIKF